MDENGNFHSVYIYIFAWFNIFQSTKLSAQLKTRNNEMDYSVIICNKTTFNPNIADI